MAAAVQHHPSLDRNETKITLEIKTKSVEQTLIPLVTQITTLVNHKERTKITERTARALAKVGEAVSLAVDRFVAVGESIGDEHPDLRSEMCETCLEARQAGNAIKQLTMHNQVVNDGSLKPFTEKNHMVRAARKLLSAITKVLLIADKVIIKQLITSKDKVLSSLTELESVDSFTDFVQAFSKFGNNMVELAHLTGDRQNDLKSDKQKAQMASARAVLEKSTMMLLPSCKTCLRHPECYSARQNRHGLFIQMRQALFLIHNVATDTGYHSVTNGNTSPTVVNGDSGIVLGGSGQSANKAIKDFEDQVEMVRVTHINNYFADKLRSALDVVIETTQDFTDSAYTSHDHREKIMEIVEQLQQAVHVLIKTGVLQMHKDSIATQELETSILKTLEVSKSLKKQLQETAMEQASELFKCNEDHMLLRSLQTAGISGEVGSVDELSVKFEEHIEQLEEVCKLFRHIATTEPLVITAEHNEIILRSMGPLILHAARTLAQYPGSKIAKENLDLFADAWESQINDLSILVKEVNDFCQGKTDRLVYMSLPRPGKHGSTSKILRPGKLDAEEQAKIAKLGLEMKLITSEMDAETDKWEEPDNDIVKRAKNMSSMAFSMYLFTRGEGPLKTTQDLFVQAEYFAEEGKKLYRTVRDFSNKVPMCPQKDDLLLHGDRIPTCCQNLLSTLKASTYGKSATFNKVDGAIQETKNLMNAIAKVVTVCFVCATKFNIDYRRSPGGTLSWRGQRSFESHPRSSYDSERSKSLEGHYRSSYDNERSRSLEGQRSLYDGERSKFYDGQRYSYDHDRSRTNDSQRSYEGQRSFDGQRSYDSRGHGSDSESMYSSQSDYMSSSSNRMFSSGSYDA
ncbi:alpha-catulin-like isoform X2 [Ruditapes philippinarum]|uniref:alpha-catulin-like isoform X2 n=1 Tax=Ruditapes philippinarum TaxID=129788 RepID=UPI00295AD603|nr:alpha-catulin-like isoform X2 [Ruditapes philippinarum]